MSALSALGTSVFGIKGMAITGAVAFALGASSGGWLAWKIADVRVLKMQNAQDAEKIKSLNDVIVQQLKDRQTSIKLETGVNAIASDTIAAISNFKDAIPDETPSLSDNACDQYSDADFERVRARTQRAIDLGKVKR